MDWTIVMLAASIEAVSHLPCVVDDASFTSVYRAGSTVNILIAAVALLCAARLKKRLGPR